MKPTVANQYLDIKYYTSLSFPFTTNLQFEFRGRKLNDINLVFNLLPAESLPFVVTKWQEYYANNMASVNDGLATQQGYDYANAMR